MVDPRHDLVRTFGVEAGKAAPPVCGTAYAAASAHLPEVVGFATLLYIVIQAGHLVWKWWCQWSDRRRAIEADKAPPAVGDEA